VHPDEAWQDRVAPQVEDAPARGLGDVGAGSDREDAAVSRTTFLSSTAGLPFPSITRT